MYWLLFYDFVLCDFAVFPRRTVVEYHRIRLNASDDLTNSAYVLTPLPSKLHIHTQSHSFTFHCMPQSHALTFHRMPVTCTHIPPHATVTCTHIPLHATLIILHYSCIYMYTSKMIHHHGVSLSEQCNAD